MVVWKKNMATIAIALLGTVVLSGCGGGGGTASTGARATFVLANSPVSGARAVSAVTARGGSGGGSGGAVVPLSAIQSLTLAITKITIEQCDAADKEYGADEEEGIHVSDTGFDPTYLKIEQGGKVTWTFDTATPHTITSGSPGDVDAGSLFDESSSGMGSTVEMVFADTGVFPYFSNNDADIAAGMAGTVEVVANDDANQPGDDDSSGGDHHGSGGGNAQQRDGGHGTLLTVFEGSVDVNLLDLSTLSQVLTSADIYAGKYCRIVLDVSNPRLVLVADPTTTITDVQLTANGHLFIKDRFELTAGQDITIVLDFGGIHLIQTGPTSYVLTPKIRAEVNPGDEETEVHGHITSIDAGSKILEVEAHEGGTIEVLVDDSTVITTGEHSSRNTSTPLTFADLAVGQEIRVDGTLGTGGQILAHEIRVENFTPPV